MNYREVYEVGRQRLERSSIENAALDARYLLEFVCHTDRNDLLIHGDREIKDEEADRYLQYIASRESHIPLQHITGTQEFMGLEFQVNEDVLIPRQDTELLVEEAMLRVHDGMRIMDMCTGSGCILLSLLHYSNDCYGLGSDISEAALAIARQNAKKLAIKADFVHGNLFEQVEGKFDIMVSNPPYIQSNVIGELMPEVREHEPRLALDGREDGLYFYKKIINECSLYLHGGASVLFETGYDQGQPVKELMEQAGFTEVTVIKDYAGYDRVVAGTFCGYSSALTIPRR